MAYSNIIPQGLFGPGILFLTRTDIANGTPINVGYVNEFSYDFAGETKELFGQNQYPLLVARGPIKATGKIKAAAFSGSALNTLLIGGAWTVGTQYDLATNANTAVPATPFTITPTPPSSGTWNADLGVTYGAGGTATVGNALTQVASAPALGQYSVAAGVYTFASQDHTNANSVIINYAYSYSTGATGESQIVTNQPIGTTPSFQLDYRTILYGASYYVRFYNCVGSKVALAHKISDFAMPEYDFAFFANAAQQVFLVSLASIN